MHRIDGPTAASALPVAPPVSGTPGYFTDGNPAAQVPATTVTSDWANTIQEEVSHVIESAGFTLDKSKNDQLTTAIDAKIQAAVDQQESAPTFVAQTNGYRIGADGYIEQWGIYNGTLPDEQNFSVTFNIAFPNECFGCTATVLNRSSSKIGNVTAQEVSLNNGSATFFAQNEGGSSTSNSGVRWRAWGH